MMPGYVQMWDVLMQMALTDLYGEWYPMIHDEWMRNLLRNRPNLSRKRLGPTGARGCPHPRLSGHRVFLDLIDALELPDPGDRHILAEAIHGRAD